MFVDNLLHGKKILITGGGTGLGKSMGHRMAELGADLVICGRRKDVLEETAAEFRDALDAKVDTFQLDVRQPERVEEMMDAIWQDRPLDVLLNNAAGNFIAQTHRLSSRALDSVLDIILHGTGYCTIACGRRWIEAGDSGHVLSIVASYAWTGGAFVVPSAMAKAGVVAMTRSLAVEWGAKGVRANAISPGLIPTKGAWDRLYPNGDENVKASIPLRRYGEHLELANLASYMVSDQAGYMNGEVVVIDGGRSHSAPNFFQENLEWSDAQWDALRPKKDD